ncbi:hypothetical protein BJY52DRAFT_1250680 [Lactarius psammicola]|nr:hypothetical protein BJY52DRAFT_1250680 [Lactarius psammicola]
MPVDLIRHLHVQNCQNAFAEAPCSVRGLYAADTERSYGHRYELDRSVSTPSGNYNHSDTNNNHRYQPDLSDILEESECRAEPGETEYSTILVADEDGRVAEKHDVTASVSEIGDGTVRNASYNAVANSSNTWTPPVAVSPFFCSPTTESTLAPPTPSESESGPSTPRYMPVLVYESASYEDALFAEFKAIIDWKAANESEE